MFKALKLYSWLIKIDSLKGRHIKFKFLKDIKVSSVSEFSFRANLKRRKQQNIDNLTEFWTSHCRFFFETVTYVFGWKDWSNITFQHFHWFDQTASKAYLYFCVICTSYISFLNQNNSSCWCYLSCRNSYSTSKVRFWLRTLINISLSCFM